MKTNKNRIKKNNRGIAMIMAMLFIAIFSSLAVSMLSISIVNVQSSGNHHKLGRTLANCYSGLDFSRYWLEKIEIPGGLTGDAQLEAIANQWQSKLDEAQIETIQPIFDSANGVITISDIAVDSQTDTFSIELKQGSGSNIQLNVIGKSGIFTKDIQVEFDLTGQGPNPIWNYGVATRGPISLTGNAHIEGVNHPSHGAVYVDAATSSSSFYIDGSCSISGGIDIVNSDIEAFVWSGNPSLLGIPVWPWANSHNDPAALAKHNVAIDSPPIDFPIPYPQQFKHYATGPEITGSMSSVYTLENAIIKAGANPTFTGIVTVNGILYIEQPNNVTFGGSVFINGFIVAEGDHENPLPGNSLSFGGNVQSSSVAALPSDPKFDPIRDKTGVSILAPGFNLNIGATFDSRSGSIAANGITFSGDPQVTVGGSVINYSNEPLLVQNSTRLRFERDDDDTEPAGFISTGDMQLEYVPDSYIENSTI